MGAGMIGGYIIMGLIGLIGGLVSRKLKSKFKTYSETPLTSNLSGKEVAEMMLADHGISDVAVIAVKGQLTDHYHPGKRTVNLSEVVYGSRNAAAAAVAAHECGHAIQHAHGYSWLKMRSMLVPVVSFSNRIIQFVIMGGILLISTFPSLLLFGCLLFAATTLFSIITLPVEYDASNRALAWIKQNNVVTPQEYDMSADALKWAARTYLVSALGSIASLLYYVQIYLSRSR